MDGEVGAGGYGADAVVDGLCEGGGGDGVDDDVGFREDALDDLGGGHGDLLRALKGKVAWHGKGDDRRSSRSRRGGCGGGRRRGRRRCRR